MIAPLVSRARILLGISGLGIGAVAFVIAGYDVVYLLGRPEYLVALYHAIRDEQTHRVLDADVATFAQLVGALVMLLGTALLALLLAYLGIPLRIRKPVPAATCGGASSTSPSVKESP